MITRRDLILLMLGNMVATLLDKAPIDYSWAGGQHVVQYLLGPLLYVASKAVGYLRMSPEERVEFHRKIARAYNGLSVPVRQLALGVVPGAFMLVLAWRILTIPDPMPVGRGYVPPTMVSRYDLIPYLPFPDKVPAPDRVERKPPPKKRMLDSKLFPFESMLAQLPIAPRVDFPMAPDEDAPNRRAPAPPANLRMLAAP